MPPLDSTARRALRARAHHLHPVVSIGQHGLTPAVIQEIDRALKAHELIKVRVHGDDRAAREALLGEICAATDSAPVQHLGKLLVIWRPNPEAPKGAESKRPAKKTPPRKPSAGKPGMRKPSMREPSTRKPAAREASTREPASAGALPRRRRGSPASGPRAAAPAGVPRAALPRRRRARG